MWKVTGRLIVRNIERFVRSKPREADLYVDMRSVPIIGNSLGGNRWAEMRIFCYGASTYEMFLKGRGVEFGYVPENGFFTALEEIRKSNAALVTPRFRVQPRFRGVCGGSNKDYESLEYQLKDALRSLTRKIIPSLWL